MNYPTKPDPTTTAQRRQRIAEYVDKGLSVREIAELVGITTQAVYLHLKKLDVDPPTRHGEQAS